MRDFIDAFLTFAINVFIFMCIAILFGIVMMSVIDDNEQQLNTLQDCALEQPQCIPEGYEDD